METVAEAEIRKRVGFPLRLGKAFGFSTDPPTIFTIIFK